MSSLSRVFVTARNSMRSNHYQNIRSFHQSLFRAQEKSDPKAHRNFYKSHGRAIFKAFTLAFLSYQIFYYAWLTLETDQIKDQTGYEIKSLEGEVRLLEEGRKSHRSDVKTEEAGLDGKRILEEKKT